MNVETVGIRPGQDVTKSHSIRGRLANGAGRDREQAAGDRVFEHTGHILVVIATLLAVFPVHVVSTPVLSRSRGSLGLLLYHLEVDDGTVAIDAVVPAGRQYHSDDVLRIGRAGADHLYLGDRGGKCHAEGLDIDVHRVGIRIGDVIADRRRPGIKGQAGYVEVTLQPRRLRAQSDRIGQGRQASSQYTSHC